MKSEDPRSCIILCGGESRRMGQDKGSMIINEKPMIIHLLESLNHHIDELIIVLNNNERIAKYKSFIESFNFTSNNDSIDFTDINSKFDFDIIFIEDEIKNKGPLSGLMTGLKNINGDYALVLPCDSPFINSNYIDYIFDILDENQNKDIHCFIPYHNHENEDLHVNFDKNKDDYHDKNFKDQLLKNCEPLHGIYEKNIHPNFIELVNSENNNIKYLISNSNSYFFPISNKVKDKTFKNINSKEDLNNI